VRKDREEMQEQARQEEVLRRRHMLREEVQMSERHDRL
jgi:hypothetical protein